jgi:hypothetical protein
MLAAAARKPRPFAPRLSRTGFYVAIGLFDRSRVVAAILQSPRISHGDWCYHDTIAQR